MLGKCEQCSETAIGFTDDALCEDCMFEYDWDETYRTDWDEEEE